jgi:hypothetical protein
MDRIERVDSDKAASHRQSSRDAALAETEHDFGFGRASEADLR